jgi:glyoxalase family protein
LVSLHYGTSRAEPTGFTVDKPIDSLGEKLVLPEWFEPNHSAIEQGLPPITLKTVKKAA